MSEDSRGHLLKQGVDVNVLLGADFHEGALELVGQHASFLRRHRAVAPQVALVAHHHLDHSLLSALLQLDHPVCDILERLPVVNRIDHRHSASPFEVGIGQVAEPLLAGRVPQLHLHLGVAFGIAVFLGDFDDSRPEVDSDGGSVRSGVVLVDETQHQVGLAHCRVADDDHLSHDVVFLILGRVAPQYATHRCYISHHQNNRCFHTPTPNCYQTTMHQASSVTQTHYHDRVVVFVLGYLAARSYLRPSLVVDPQPTLISLHHRYCLWNVTTHCHHFYTTLLPLWLQRLHILRYLLVCDQFSWYFFRVDCPKRLQFAKLQSWLFLDRRFFHFLFLLGSLLGPFAGWLLALLLHDIIIIMSIGVGALQQRVRVSKQRLESGEYHECLSELKELERIVREKLGMGDWSEGEHDKLLEIQVMIYNNLACLYENKGKYKSSLYHLEVAQRLQTALVTAKYKDQPMPPVILEQLSTTYSNLSAVRSKMGHLKEATSDVEFAIKIMKGDPSLAEHSSLAFLYYNYSFLLSRTGKLQKSIKYAKQGLEICQKSQSRQMTGKFQFLLKQLSDKAERVIQRQQKQVLKYVRGETGIVKTVDNLRSNDVCLQQLPKMQQAKGTQANFFRAKQPLYSSPHARKGPIQTPSSTQSKFRVSHNRSYRKTSQKGRQNLSMTRTEEENRSRSESRERGQLIFEAYGIPHRRVEFRKRLHESIRESESQREGVQGHSMRKVESQSHSRGAGKDQALEKIIEKLYLTEKK